MNARIYTAEEKRSAILREINYRKYVYGKRVAAGSMKQVSADRGLAIFEQILADYDKMVEAERLL